MAKRAAKSAKAGKPAAKGKSDKSNVVAQARAGKARGQQRNFWRWLWQNVISLAGAIVIYLFLKTLFVEAYRIPSGSMIPTLLVGDWLFVNKLAYGPAIPFTHAHLPGYTHPKHGDVVVFISPPQLDNGADSTPTLVKRLIGMPGDTLYMRAGVVYLNGIPQRLGFASHNPTGDSGLPGVSPSDSYDPDFEWQHSVEIKNSRFGPPPARPVHDNWGPIVVPADHYFMMGDNRYCSKDSRYWGIVPKENVRGRPLFVYYSYVPGPGDETDACSGDTSDRPLSFITDIRWSRIGHWVR